MTAPDGTDYPIVWPEDVALKTDGRYVRFDPRLREIPPARCPAPWWLAGRAARD